MEIFSTYSRQARLFPGAIIGLPITTLLAVVFINRPAWWSGVLALLGASGATYLATQLIRSMGRAGEQRMWMRWGGAPTTVRLRYSGASNAALVDRRHRVLAKLCPDEQLPSASEESADPVAADAVYETVVSILRARTRDGKKFALLLQENASYGFRRNLLACKSYGYISLALSAVATLVLLIVDVFGQHVISPGGAAAVIVLDLVGWIVARWRVNEAWVRDAGEAYADRLFEAAEELAAS